jgi:hypothetical protein
VRRRSPLHPNDEQGRIVSTGALLAGCPSDDLFSTPLLGVNLFDVDLRFAAWAEQFAIRPDV